MRARIHLIMDCKLYDSCRLILLTNIIPRWEAFDVREVLESLTLDTYSAVIILPVVLVL